MEKGLDREFQKGPLEAGEEVGETFDIISVNSLVMKAFNKYMIFISFKSER